MNFADWIQKNKKLVITGGVVFVVILVVIGIFSKINSIDNEGYEKQRDVISKYNQFKNEVSTCIDNTNVGASIASEEYEQVQAVLEAVVSARYGEGDDAALSGDAFVSVLVEEYPEVDRSLWKQLMTTALGCRNQAKGVNNELQALAGRFDTWANSGGLFDKPFRSRYPTDELKVTTFEGVKTGQDALDFIVTPVTTKEAEQGLQRSEMPDQSDLFDEEPTE